MIQYFEQHQDDVLSSFVQHLQIAGTALGIALLIALPLGIFIARHARLYGPVMGVLSVIYTIPSLALLSLLVPYVGIGTAPALIALVAYAQFILVRNTVTGLRGVDPAIVEAARGMGMSGLQILGRIELPLALPVIVAGVRIATVTTIGVTAIAAYIGAGGLGHILFDGINQGYNEKIEAGAVAVGVLAILADLLLRLVEGLARRASGGRPAARAT